MLSRRESYYKCSHHDWKMFDFDGRMIPPGPPTSQPMMSSEQFSHYVPLKLRRPPAPYRLPRVIVNSFTSLLFGQGRWPTIRVHGDPKTEDFANALVKESRLRTLMIRARNMGGSSGSVGLSWRFYAGRPRVQAHNPKHIFIHEWEDREELIPAHVSEIYTYSKEEWDPEKRKWVDQWFWYRRDWTAAADIAFLPAKYDANEDPVWEIDEEKTVFHNDGACHFVWIQNLPEDDLTSIDGQPDYAELYESFESLDLLKSVVVRGSTLNLDPTLVLRMDPDIFERLGVKKGSDNALVVGETGDARYMELAGTSISAGVELIAKMRDAILETAQCVIADPNEVGGAGTSSVALKVIYEPMLAKTEILREQYGEGIKRLIKQMLDVARDKLAAPPQEIEVVDEVTGEPALDEAGQPIIESVVLQFNLQPRIRVVKTTDELTGNEVETIVREERHPGEGGEIELDWGDYFNPTADDRMKAAQTLQLATVAKIISQQSATEEMAASFERDIHEEWDRLVAERDREEENLSGMFADETGAMGGQEEPTVAVIEPDEDEGLVLGVMDVAKIVTVNEGRAAQGLGPLLLADGQLDPDGSLTVAEFGLKRKAAATLVGEAEGTVEAQVIAPELAEEPELL